MTTPEYPVTPGDVYTLSFLTATGAVTSSIVIDAEGKVNLSNIGIMDARNMRFVDLKKGIEKKVLDAYALSAPQVLIESCGIFPVYVEGEVLRAKTVYLWGLSRLSELWTDVTPYSSNRYVTVTGRDGRSKDYDIFKVWRFGDLGQNPYLKPFDTVRFNRFDRSVKLAGAVHRPGDYQILPGENISQLIEYYGGGLLDTAQPEYTTIVRRSSDAMPQGMVINLNYSSGTQKLPDLMDGDSVSIASSELYLPVVYFEGAISPEAEAALQYGMDRQTYRKGDKLSRALRMVANRILPTADLKRAFIVRKGQADTVPVNLERLLYAYEEKDDLALEPQDRIIIPFGSQQVFVTGEVAKSSWVDSSGTVRLRKVIEPLLTKYSSIRDVVIVNESGEAKSYDLFKADREGDLSEDPFVTSGDVIIVKEVQRLVTIEGQVRKPGSYQLLPQDDLKALIEIYGGGLTEKANAERISLVRSQVSESILGEKRVIDFYTMPHFTLAGFDTLSVPTSQDFLPAVFFEGALGVGVNGDSLQAAQRIPYAFTPGETLSQAVQKIRAQFSAVSDLKNAYMERGSTKVPVDIETLLYTKDYSKDMPLAAGDTIIVPFRQFFVSVSGSVFKPGRYPYVPDRRWDYYVNLAGGIDEEKNSGQKLAIWDVKGEQRTPEHFVMPEDSIVVAQNSFLYIFGQVSPILTTSISLAALLLSLYRIIFP
jgi:protein involved in polysaccharide export with SLBB domain